MNRIAATITALIATIVLPISAIAAEADAELEAVREKVSSMFDMIDPCLLYTSDAADELRSV